MKTSSVKPGNDVADIMNQVSVGISAVIRVDQRLDGASLETWVWMRLWVLAPVNLNSSFFSGLVT